MFWCMQGDGDGDDECAWHSTPPIQKLKKKKIRKERKKKKKEIYWIKKNKKTKNKKKWKEKQRECYDDTWRTPLSPCGDLSPFFFFFPSNQSL